MSLLKNAETIEMSIDIPDSEKKIGAKISSRLEKILTKLNFFEDHLDIIYNPFKKYNVVSQESIHKYRGSLWDYLQQIQINIDNIKEMVVLTIGDLKVFSSDTHINELISTFTDSFGDIEELVKSLTDIISDWDSDTYKEDIIKEIDLIKQSIEEFKILINDRIIDHINTNILCKNWLEDLDDHMKENINESKPIVTKLYREREEKLNKVI
jgi:hypothetical protein